MLGCKFVLFVTNHNFIHSFFFIENVSLCKSVTSTNKTPSKKTQLEDGSDFLNITKKAVVILTRLPEYKISALRPPTPQQFYSEDESLCSSDSDMQWEPEGDSSDSDFSLSKKKQKMRKPPKIKTTKTPAPQMCKNNNNNGKATTLNSHYKSFIFYNSSSIYVLTNTFLGFSVASEPAPVIISSAFAYCPNEIRKTRPNLPDEEVKVEMTVLARRRPMRWQRGKIVEIVTRGTKMTLFGNKSISST